MSKDNFSSARAASRIIKRMNRLDDLEKKMHRWAIELNRMAFEAGSSDLSERLRAISREMESDEGHERG